MARPQKLSLLSIDALLKLRDDVAAALGRKADALKKELSSLGSDYAEVGRIAVYGKKKRLAPGPQGAHQVPGQVGKHLGRAWGSTPLVDRGNQGRREAG